MYSVEEKEGKWILKWVSGRFHITMKTFETKEEAEADLNARKNN